MAAKAAPAVHLADLVLFVGAGVVALLCLFIPCGPFDGEVLSPLSLAALAAAFALLGAGTLRRMIPQQRPRWFWPVQLVALWFAWSGVLRVVNALDASEPTVHRTHVAQWRTKHVSGRGTDQWVRWVTLPSLTDATTQFELRVPDGAVTREDGFVEASLARREREWKERTLRQLRAEEDQRYGELMKVMEARGERREPVLPAFPAPPMEELLWPEGGPCELLTRPGALGLEHVVGLRLLVP